VKNIYILYFIFFFDKNAMQSLQYHWMHVLVLNNFVKRFLFIRMRRGWILFYCYIIAFTAAAAAAIENIKFWTYANNNENKITNENRNAVCMCVAEKCRKRFLSLSSSLQITKNNKFSLKKKLNICVWVIECVCLCGFMKTNMWEKRHFNVNGWEEFHSATKKRIKMFNDKHENFPIVVCRIFHHWKNRFVKNIHIRKSYFSFKVAKKIYHIVPVDPRHPFHEHISKIFQW
jgi:hypothetical protein